MNLPMVIRQVGRFLLVMAVLLAIHGLVAASHWWSGDPLEEPAFWAFLVAAGASLVLGLVASITNRHASREIGRREACLLVVTTWVVGALVASLPFRCWSDFCTRPESGLLAGFANPFFEAMSGLTTCGATIVTDVEALPASILLWRSTIQWIGGLGVVVLFVAVLPSLGTGGKRMFLTESTGPTPEGIRPHAQETARTLWAVYLGLTIAEFLALMVCGMSPFDAICHAFTTVSTGGFSTRNASIAAFDSVAVEMVVTVFMFLSGIGFSLYYLAVRGRYRSLLRSPELRLYAAIAGFITLACTLTLWIAGLFDESFQIKVIGEGAASAGIFESFRYSVFTTVSILTTTGYGTAVFEDWPGIALVCLMAIILVGGMAGSTAGGMKIIRVWIAGKLMLLEIEREFRPDVIRPLKVGRSMISPEVRTAAVVFVLFTLGLVGLGAGLLKVFEGTEGIDLTTALSASASAIANVGPGLGRVGSDDNYAWMTPASKFSLSGLMLLGRLELFVVLALFTRRFWRRS